MHHSISAVVSDLVRRTRTALLALAGWIPPRRGAHALTRPRGDSGQATAEYALVLLGAAAVALLLVAWATNTGKVDDLLDAVIDNVLDQV